MNIWTVASACVTQRAQLSALQHVDALPTEYVIGLGWDRASDRYRIRVKPMHEVSTNRELLSALTRSFDPLGFCLRF
jgi:hypothetical protein